jgi:hypothetical protein
LGYRNLPIGLPVSSHNAASYVCFTRTVGIDHNNSEAESTFISLERDLGSVWRPRRLVVLHATGGDSGLPAPVGVHNVNLRIGAGVSAAICNLRPIGRPRRVHPKRRRKSCSPGAIGVHDSDMEPDAAFIRPKRDLRSSG